MDKDLQFTCVYFQPNIRKHGISLMQTDMGQSLTMLRDVTMAQSLKRVKTVNKMDI